MTYDPKEHLMKLKGKDYLECRERVRWMRDNHKDARITTELIYHDQEKGVVVIRASVELPANGAIATGICEGDRKGFAGGYIEKCETQAIGRALALLGYGTEYSGDELSEGLEENPNGKLADSPRGPAPQDPRPVAAKPKTESPEPPTLHVVPSGTIAADQELLTSIRTGYDRLGITKQIPTGLSKEEGEHILLDLRNQYEARRKQSKAR